MLRPDVGIFAVGDMNDLNIQSILKLGLRRVVKCLSTRTVDNYSSTISRTRIFGRKKKKKKSRSPGTVQANAYPCQGECLPLAWYRW